MFSIGFRYCGGCNPQIDRARAIRELKENLRKRSLPVHLTSDRGKKVDLVLLVNGCMHACLEEIYMKEGQPIPCISVKGEMIDSEYVIEDWIADFLESRISSLLDLEPSSSHADGADRG